MATVPHPHPTAKAGLWRDMVSRLSEDIDRERVFADICDAGLTTGRYVMMSVLSAAIATLGLMLSSPAVVIGAMLLSPLMGPIILLGFSFWTIDWLAARRALTSLAVGLGVALVVAVLLTWASPLKEPTAEILARTRPNLFDLLVAAFSGLAGGYAVIRQRGETVIGVAIATALMPPIATVGFGIGTANWPVTLGALLLFATNLIAIALAAAAMSALYGFRPHYHLANRGWIGHVTVILIVIALCVPLTLSLNTIALESRATVNARDAIQDLFGPKARVTALSVRSQGGALQVDGLVATPKYITSASGKVAAKLKSTLGAAARVSLDQVVLADPSKLVAAAPAAEAPDPVVAAVQSLKDAVPFPADSIAYDPAAHRGLVLLSPSSGLDLAAAAMLEQGLRGKAGLENTVVVPPLQALPPIAVTLSRKAPPAFGDALATDVWALQRWRSQGVAAAVCGLSRRDRRDAAVIAAAGAALKPLNAEVSIGDSARCAGKVGQGPWLQLTPG
jgi:uncharacterized hydrophobic protein (TIGR00271 family)